MDGSCGLAQGESERPKFKYRPRDPTGTLLYKAIQEHFEPFVAALESDPSAKGMPDYVKKEFREFLACGVLAHGFTRYRCGACEEELLVAFSCKNRGFCPSCLGRRMAEVAAHLTDHVIPNETIRQWVVTLPIPMRYWCASSRELTAAINKIAVTEVGRYYKEKAAEAEGLSKDDLHPGVITFLQRFGSALNLNLHLHLVALDGVYLDRSKRKLPPKFIPVDPPKDEEVEAILQKVVKKAVSMLRKKGYLEEAVEEVLPTGQDPLFEEEPEHSRSMAASVQNRIAFGPRAGENVRRFIHRIHSAFGYEEDSPQTTKPKCAALNGFTIHAQVKVKKHRHDSRERLIRSGLRQGFGRQVYGSGPLLPQTAQPR